MNQNVRILFRLILPFKVEKMQILCRDCSLRSRIQFKVRIQYVLLFSITDTSKDKHIPCFFDHYHKSLTQVELRQTWKKQIKLFSTSNSYYLQIARETCSLSIECKIMVLTQAKLPLSKNCHTFRSKHKNLLGFTCTTIWITIHTRKTAMTAFVHKLQWYLYFINLFFLFYRFITVRIIFEA